MATPKWPHDHSAKHSVAAKKGWAHRRVKGVEKRKASSRYGGRDIHLTAKEEEAVKAHNKRRQEEFLRTRDKVDALYEQLRKAEKAGKPTKRIANRIHTLRRKIG